MFKATPPPPKIQIYDLDNQVNISSVTLMVLMSSFAVHWESGTKIYSFNASLKFNFERVQLSECRERSQVLPVGSEFK